VGLVIQSPASNRLPTPLPEVNSVLTLAACPGETTGNASGCLSTRTWRAFPKAVPKILEHADEAAWTITPSGSSIRTGTSSPQKTTVATVPPSGAYSAALLVFLQAQAAVISSPRATITGPPVAAFVFFVAKLTTIAGAYRTRATKSCAGSPSQMSYGPLEAGEMSIVLGGVATNSESSGSAFIDKAYLNLPDGTTSAANPAMYVSVTGKGAVRNASMCFSVPAPASGAYKLTMHELRSKKSGAITFQVP